MKTYKFRGKRVDNGEWVYGYYWVNKSATRETTHIVNEYGDIFQTDPETVGMFTGVIDRKGQEIYDNDIVKHRVFGIKLIRWGSSAENGIFEDQAGFMFDRTIAFLCGTDGNTIEKIGNLFDNPDLIQEI